MRDRLDSYDRKILSLLQRDGSMGPADLSQHINLSASQCSRRLQRLREEGYIARTAAILNPAKLNLGISAYVAIRLRVQSRDMEQAFREKIGQLPEVISCDYTTGDMDFMLRIQTRDLESYSEFLSERLLADDQTQSVTTFVVMKQVKNTTELPLDYC